MNAYGWFWMMVITLSEASGRGLCPFSQPILKSSQSLGRFWQCQFHEMGQNKTGLILYFTMLGVLLHVWPSAADSHPISFKRNLGFYIFNSQSCCENATPMTQLLFTYTVQCKTFHNFSIPLYSELPNLF